MKGNLIVISSPSGGGKGTLIKEILKSLPDIAYSVSFTTRKMRQGEENGRDYFFVSREEFESLIVKDEFLEYAEVHGNFYGTSKTQVIKELESGRDIILEIDVQGAENIMQKFPSAVSIFILPPSFEVLRQRLIARGTETEEALVLRLKNAFNEVRKFSAFQYIVVNDEISRATKDLETIILSERLRSIRQNEVIQGILDSFDISKFNSVGD
jgi:guanylate kinase